MVEREGGKEGRRCREIDEVFLRSLAAATVAGPTGTKLSRGHPSNNLPCQLPQWRYLGTYQTCAPPSFIVPQASSQEVEHIVGNILSIIL